jgi:endonuclease/exonuclease/phosphatase family metal-dependent hydrolase
MKLRSSALFLVTVLVSYVSAVRIGSFNLHQYGPKKSSNATLTNMVAQIISGFDLGIIQEISDASLKAPYILLEALNKLSPSKPYTMTLSARVGDSATKEQYIFFNRESTSGLEVVSSYLFDDSVPDYFERAPYAVTFKVKNPRPSGVHMFTVMNVHLKPEDAYQELINMRQVIEDFIQTNPQYFSDTPTSLATALEQNVEIPTEDNKPSLKTNHPILIVGDFNADCSYVSAKKLETLQTVYFPDFAWVINGPLKTNTRQTCTYDRVVVNGDKFLKAIVPNSNTTVNFGEMFGMDLAQQLKISDHLPIKFDVKW